MRYVSILIVLFFTLVSTVHGQARPMVSANNAILMEQSSGRVLYEKKAHEKQPIASITKIMTAIVAIESGKMDEIAKASRRAIYTEGSSIYLEQGEKMSIEDLLYGLMLRSGNDAAVAIGEHIGGSMEGFVYLMNEKARWLGMTNTHFENPHGLHSNNHYSTAYDMALLMKYAMDNKTFRKISSTESYKSEKRTYAWRNKNKLLTRYYDFCTGGKTGYTKIAGRTLVSSAKKENMDLIAVTFNAPDDWNDHISLYEWGYSNYDLEKLDETGLQLYKLNKEIVEGAIKDAIFYPLDEQEKNNIKKKSFLLRKENRNHQIAIGKTIYYLNEKEIGEVPIHASIRTADEVTFTKTLSVVIKQIMRVE
ncbi:D-alanyl-D-alanine carboxypeptidase family protein [Virgibacillus sp. MG-45]|uniref:D-alanyl-D-alanine carboxypeptidase family protein n=1 Tax=Virgibacillus sp. MG-45 TaxID=3102791 RepID=UPI002ED7B231